MINEDKKMITRTGRTTIDDPNRRNHSKRCAEGSLSVIKKKCAYCGHHKALVNTTRTKCSKCKKEV